MQKQAETEVSVKRQIAFPLAFICILIARKHSKFIDILVGRFMDRCPYLLCLSKATSTDTKEMNKEELGYIRDDEGIWEQDFLYEERMSGVVALYAALTQSRIGSTGNPDGFTLEDAWRWLSIHLNRQPVFFILYKTRVVPLLIHAFLEICGARLMEVYKSQTCKIVTYVLEEYVPGCLALKIAEASITRLQLFVEESSKGFRPYQGSILEK